MQLDQETVKELVGAVLGVGALVFLVEISGVPSDVAVEAIIGILGALGFYGVGKKREQRKGGEQ